jgi:hypothetical protein
MSKLSTLKNLRYVLRPRTANDSVATILPLYIPQVAAMVSLKTKRLSVEVLTPRTRGDRRRLKAPHRLSYLPMKASVQNVHTFDGATIAIHRLNGAVHRDPTEGPAFHQSGTDDARAYYLTHGRLHRDPADGPALFDNNYQPSGHVAHGYFWEGLPHRPWREGPALHLADHAGFRHFEAYSEHGVLHRDPRQGAALTEWNDKHEIICEEFWWDGRQVDPDAFGDVTAAPGSGRQSDHQD